MYMMSKALV